MKKIVTTFVFLTLSFSQLAFAKVASVPVQSQQISNVQLALAAFEFENNKFSVAVKGSDLSDDQVLADLDMAEQLISQGQFFIDLDSIVVAAGPDCDPVRGGGCK